MPTSMAAALTPLAAVQSLLIGAVLLWSARIKLFDRRAAELARTSALRTLLGEDRAVRAYRLLGVVELGLGLLLVLPPAPVVEPVAAAALTAGFTGYLWYARRVAPGSSCGCLSARTTPVTGRAIARAAVLLAAAVFGAVAGGALSPGADVAPRSGVLGDGFWGGDGEYWLTALREHPAAAVALLLVEAAVVVALSAEFDRYWLLPLRRLRARLTHPLRGVSGVPLLASVQVLQRSSVYRQVAALLTSDVREHWLADGWRMVCYSARYQGRPATAVFAVPVEDPQPEQVRVALVDDQTGVTLASLADAPAAAR